MPINLADPGEELTVLRIGGSAEIKQHLADLGFTPGAAVTLIGKLGDGVIVKVKESRVALDCKLAERIMI